MKYLKQFGIILLISLMGEALRMLLPLPIPASVYGLVLMLIALMTGIIKFIRSKKYLLFDRNHAGDVYSGRSRTFRSMAVASTGVDTGCCHFVCYDNYCNGSDRTRSTENHREGEKEDGTVFH